MAQSEVRNWFGDIASHPAEVVEVHSPEDIVAVLTNPERYPSPVRATGSNHSVTRCGVVTGGTLVKMTKMNHILNITNDTVTAEAGVLYLDLAEALEKRDMQLHVNTEIGNLTLGSAACAGTKDASMPGEFGQVNSYAIGVKMILPSGDRLEVTEDAQPELMKLVRSSYGLFGIVYEVTFRIRPMEPMVVYHETFTLDEFIQSLPELVDRQESIMMYMFPFENTLTVEFRKYNPTAKGWPDRIPWKLRNYAWKNAGPKFAHDVTEKIDNLDIRYSVIDKFHEVLRFKLTTLIRGDHTFAPDQIIRYPETSDTSRYTFSLWAFPEQSYPVVLREYFSFCQDYYKKTGYRCNLPNVGYRITQDQQSHFSYCYDGNILTIDPVSTANPGWIDFLHTYNDFASERGGRPLFNQTYGLKRQYIDHAFGDLVQQFENQRLKFDPHNRMLNPYFRELFSS